MIFEDFTWHRGEKKKKKRALHQFSIVCSNGKDEKTQIMVHFPISYFGACNCFAWFQRKEQRNYVQCFQGGGGFEDPGMRSSSAQKTHRPHADCQLVWL